VSGSLKFRLLIPLLITDLLIGGIIVGGGSLFVRYELLRAFDSELRGRVDSVISLVEGPDSPGAPLRFDNSAALLSRHDIFQVYSSDGNLIANSPGFSDPNTLRRLSGRSFSEETVHGKRYRILTAPAARIFDQDISPSPIFVGVVYGSPIEPVEKRVRSAALLLALAAFAILGISIAVLFITINNGLRPVYELAQAALALGPGEWKLDPSRSPSTVAELQPLKSALLDLSHRVDLAFVMERDFTANAAHELKTAVAILKSTLQLLHQRPRTQSEYLEGIEAALEDTSRLEQLTSKLLQLAKAEHSRTPTSTINVEEVLDDLTTRFRPVADRKGVQLLLHCEGDTTLASLSREDLDIAISNLLENAIRYSPAGGKVLIEAMPSEDGVSITVNDSGRGIRPELLPRIFEKFHRTDESRSRETGSFGLGLAIVKAIVTRASGQVEVQSVLGQGTTFHISLPYIQKSPHFS
jgi:signal transduction histidine kinase